LPHIRLLQVMRVNMRLGIRDALAALRRPARV